MAQDYDAERDSVRSNTKYGVLLKKKGRFIKFEDFKEEKFSLDPDYGIPKIKVYIRKFYEIDKNYYFLCLRIGVKYTFVEYSDLVEINKAIVKLRYEVGSDCLKQPEYLKNIYISDDDFEIGYWVTKKNRKYSPTWYLYLDNTRYAYNIIYIDYIQKMFQEKQAEIEDMMAKDK